MNSTPSSPSGSVRPQATTVAPAAGGNDDVRFVVLRAEGRGFNAGVDIKEMQSTGRAGGDAALGQRNFDALIGANRGCFAAFAAVYDCAVPVIAAVHGYCLGGGI